MATKRANPSGSRPAKKVRNPRSGRGSLAIVGVGASAGGLEAFTDLLKHLPLDTGMAFVLVQHLDPLHESALTQLLSRATALPVQEITDKLRIQPNHVYVIPRNANLAIAHGVLRLQPRPKTRAPHRPIDSFLESLAQDQRQQAMGVILSGTATDGTLGLEAIKAEGGITFAQDDSARYDSMPRSAEAAGCVDYVLSPKGIAKELARIARHPYVARGRGELATPEDDRAFATAHEDDATALPSGGRGTARTGARRARDEAAQRGHESTGIKEVDNGFKKIVLLLRNHCGVDFSLYKSTTIQRRIARRMVLNRHSTLEGYAKFLRGNVKELDALYSDVLISVTSFFRSPESFDVLKQKVFPKLLQARSDDPLRVWVLGCSTGQEAYSIAMTFVEAADKVARMRKLQVFATDLNDALLDKARHGLYAKSLAQDVGPERLRRFFVEEEGGYRIVKPLREMVVFARQNLIDDPPFSRMDLVSCRNLLIYLEPSVQKKALPTFHYALKPGGFLFLGASESVGGFADLFEPVDKRHKIYAKKAAPTPAHHLPVRAARGAEPYSRRTPAPVSAPIGSPQESFRGELEAQREADRVTVNRFAPPGVLVNAELQIVQFRGSTSAYLEPPTGKASFDVLKMARDGLMPPLRAAINKAKKENRKARKDNVRIVQGRETRMVNVEVIPLKNLRERSFLILFEDAPKTKRGGATAPIPAATERGIRKSAGSPAAKDNSRRIAELESDLTESRDHLQSAQEQHEAANEELQAASEEVQSANEELQSVNEELETSKEELESTNEELTTVNEEMVNRNAELNRLNSDLVNLQTSTKVAILLLGRDLTIRRFSAQAEKQFKLVAGDIGRPIGNLRHDLVFAGTGTTVHPPGEANGRPRTRKGRARAGGRSRDADASSAPATRPPPDLESVIAEVIAAAQELEHEVRDREGRWYLLRVRPYFTFDHKVDGAVLVLVDIDGLKRREQAISEALEYAEAIVRTARDPLLVLDADLRVDTANDAFYTTFKISPAQSVGRLVYELGNGQWNIPRLRELLTEILPRNSFFNDVEVTHDFESLGRRTMLLNARKLDDAKGKVARILLGIQDITETLQFQSAARENVDKFRLLFERSPLPKWTFDLETLRFVDVNETAIAKYGYSREEFLQMRVLDLLPKEDAEALTKNALAAPAHRPSERSTTRHRKKNGELLDVEVQGNELVLAGKRIWLASINDITERKQAEETLERMAAELVDDDRHKDEFLALLAHELRGPLAPLRNLLEVVRRAGANTEVVKEAAGAMERQLGTMRRLVDDLLDASRISRGKLTLQPESVELAAVVRQAVDAAQPAITAARQQLTVTLPTQPVYLRADATRLAQVLGNLLSNAEKFSDPGSDISLVAEQRGDEAVVTVEDTGIGIAADQLPHVFDMFAQVDRSLERARSGLGIGLTLARQLVEMHGGSLQGFSEGLGRGSRFLVRLPILVEPAQQGAPEAAQAEVPTLTGRRILVVDDNRDSAESLAALLSMSGNETRTAHDGLAAVEAAAAFRPDTVLLDIGLPKLNGYEVARRIRQQPWGRNAVMLALTGWGQDEDRRKSSEAGFDGHLVKPVEYGALVRMLIIGYRARSARMD